MSDCEESRARIGRNTIVNNLYSSIAVINKKISAGPSRQGGGRRGENSDKQGDGMSGVMSGVQNNTNFVGGGVNVSNVQVAVTNNFSATPTAQGGVNAPMDLAEINKLAKTTEKIVAAKSGIGRGNPRPGPGNNGGGGIGGNNDALWW